MGAGGIGSYLGAMLARAGAEVTLVCRGRHLAAIQATGLSLSSPRETFSVRVAATDRPPGEQDVVIQAVKLYDLATSTRQMLPMVGPRTMVVPIQNGVTAAHEVGSVLGMERVVAGTVFMNSHVTAPGVVTCKSEINTLYVGELDHRRTERVARFAEISKEAGIDARIPADIRLEQWRKFIPIGWRQRLAMQEVADLAAAKGVALERDIVERMLVVAQRYKYDARVSMLEDLEAGKPLELDWLSGYVSREAAKIGVAAPFHDLAYVCLRGFNR